MECMAVRRTLTTCTLGALLTLALLAGCSTDPGSGAGSGSGAGAGSSDPASLPATELLPAGEAEALVEDGWVLLDVRTPEEWAEGRLADATLVDFSAPTFEAEVADLDPAQQYVVYCRSGNRAGGAVETMRAAGLTAVNAGAFDALAAAGLPTA